ncbi:MAG: right-handed parallel beta-helix repeat-containing protein [Halofilum sp. (in: g-proteobacteria)]|nr:right-handed parallel beta-helix repeat-containing protein [Halofilum sp. (in: g-proteobacteria)]
MRSTFITATLWTVLVLLAPVASASAAIRVVGPENYREALAGLEPGDTLALQAGDYRDGLPVHGLEGTADEPIHIAGPASGRPAVFHGRRGHNVVSIIDSRWVTIRDIEIDGGGLAVDGVKAEGHADFAHHITLSDLRIHNLAPRQQIVGISTKCPAHGWVIRNTEIRGAGTGLYLGDSDGSAPFVGGLIEHNLVTGSIGYAMQIKHQDERPSLDGLPSTPSRTTIRHNVFAKGESSSTTSARPNVLLGHFPPRGPGTSDRYAVYGNLFYNNPTERLFQGEGNIALYNNLFVNPAGGAIAIMPHKGDPRRIDIFHNTIVARDTGIWFKRSERTERALVTGNAVLAGKPFSGDGASAEGNVADAYERADEYLRAPFAEPGALDLVAREGRLRGSVSLPPEVLWKLPDAGRDFDGRERVGERLGAYDGSGEQPRWVPELAIKPVVSGDGSVVE